MKKSSYTAYVDTVHWFIMLSTKCRLSRHGQMKALSLSLLTFASPLLLAMAMALKGSVHMISDLNSQANNSIDRRNLFCHMQVFTVGLAQARPNEYYITV